jgi:hypothetical protein
VGSPWERVKTLQGVKCAAGFELMIFLLNFFLGTPREDFVEATAGKSLAKSGVSRERKEKSREKSKNSPGSQVCSRI